jgi:hypothetical protein
MEMSLFIDHWIQCLIDFATIWYVIFGLESFSIGNKQEANVGDYFEYLDQQERHLRHEQKRNDLAS